jgi:hypothetical protein
MVILGLFIWMLVGISIIKIYSNFNIFIVDTNVESYRLRCWLMMSFLGILNIFLVPIIWKGIK